MIRDAKSTVMMATKVCGLALALVLASTQASAQAASAVADGITFAKSIAPTSASQLVNPNGVNSTAWTGSTSTPTAVPSTLGTFSTPNVSTTPYTTASAIGLSAYGTQATVNCANYNAATGDPTQAQTCAAVNFLTNRCLSPTTKQGAILAANSTSTSVTGDCSGTYGQAQASYGFAEQESSSDSVFTSVTNLGSTASSTTSQTCTVQTVVTTPAQYATVNCTKNDSSSDYACYQYLNTAIETTYTPAQTTDTCTAPAVLQNGYCVSQSTNPAPVVYGCPPGQTLEGQSCVSTSSSPATPVYSCPAGFTLNGGVCAGESTAAQITSTSCPTVSGQANGFTGVYSGKTIDGVTGYCGFTFESLSPGDPMTYCKGEFPAPINGSILFYATQKSASLGRELAYFNTCYLTPELTCPSGYTWNGSVCQEPATVNATVIGYSCSTGTLSGSQCVVTTSNPADPSYQCPNGTVLSGSDCVSTTSTPPGVTYSCPNGSAPVNTLCITPYVVTSWVDTCGPYETSAGVTLPTPN